MRLAVAACARRERFARWPPVRWRCERPEARCPLFEGAVEGVIVPCYPSGAFLPRAASVFGSVSVQRWLQPREVVKAVLGLGELL